MEKLTQCGCAECEDKIGKLLKHVLEVSTRYDSEPKQKCKFARQIPDTPNKN